MERKTEPRVVIGVVPSGEFQGKPMINQDYLEAVFRAGGLPTLFPFIEDTDQLFRLACMVDGLLLTGGVDVDPLLYGEEKSPLCGEVSSIRDAMEFPLVRFAAEKGIPVLGICRGLQVMNCALGGTLYQDLQQSFSRDINHSRPDAPADPIHEVRILPGSLLSSAAGAEALRVNSRHHQGIQNLAPTLSACARASDGLIEGIEMPQHPFFLGVQWHPESMSSHDANQQALFNALVEKGREFRISESV